MVGSFSRKRGPLPPTFLLDLQDAGAYDPYEISPKNKWIKALPQKLIFRNGHPEMQANK